MGNLGHQAARLAASKICDNIVKGLCKDPETEVVKLIDMWQKFMGDEKIDLNYDSARKMICDKDCTLNKYMHRLINEIDPHVLKTIALNLGFEAFVYGTKTIRKNREKYGCNVPWLILMDPTSACNLHCTGCWAAEYGHKLNLTFDEMDKVVTQGLEYICICLQEGSLLSENQTLLSSVRSTVTVHFWHSQTAHSWMRPSAQT